MNKNNLRLKREMRFNSLKKKPDKIIKMNPDLLKRTFLSDKNYSIIHKTIQQNAIKNNKTVPSEILGLIKQHAGGTYKANSKKPNNINLENYLIMLNNHVVKICLSKMKDNPHSARMENDSRMNNLMQDRNNPMSGNSNTGLGATGPLSFDKLNSRKGENLTDDYNRQISNRKINNETAKPGELPDFLKPMKTRDEETSPEPRNSEMASTTITAPPPQVQKENNLESMFQTMNLSDEPKYNQNNNTKNSFEYNPNSFNDYHQQNSNSNDLEQIFAAKTTSSPVNNVPETNNKEEESINSFGLPFDINFDYPVQNNNVPVTVPEKKTLATPGNSVDDMLEIEKKNGTNSIQNIKEFDYCLTMDSFWRRFSYSVGNTLPTGGDGAISVYRFDLGRGSWTGETDELNDDVFNYNSFKGGVIEGIQGLKNVVEIDCIQVIVPKYLFRTDDVKLSEQNNYPVAASNSENDNVGLVESAIPVDANGIEIVDCDNKDNSSDDEDDCIDEKQQDIIKNKFVSVDGTTKKREESNYVKDNIGQIGPFIYLAIDEFEGQICPSIVKPPELQGEKWASKYGVKTLKPGQRVFAKLVEEKLDNNGLLMIPVYGKVTFQKPESFSKLTVRYYDSLGYPLLWNAIGENPPDNQVCPITENDNLQNRIITDLRVKMLRKSAPILLENLE